MSLYPVILLFVAACSSGDDEIRGVTIECAIGSAAEMAGDCRLETVSKGGQTEFVVHHPDGGFRRLDLTPDGKGLVSADGADEAKNVVEADLIQVNIGQDRYRFPATMVGHDDEP